MHCIVEKKIVDDIRASDIVQQTSFWANIKVRQGFKPLAFKYRVSAKMLKASSLEKKYFQDDLLVLVRFISDEYCFAYIPYGPEIEPEYENQGIFLEELSETLRPYLPAKCILIRYDLHWENQWACEEDLFDGNGDWKGPPSVISQEFRVNFNTKKKNLVKSPGDILPANTIFINLKQSKDDLLKKMKSKTRYNIRLSMRKGVRVGYYGPDNLHNFYSLYENTSKRNKFTLHPADNFHYLLTSSEKKRAKIKTHLLIAGHEGEFLSAMVLVLSGKRGTYLYGASSDSKRNLMASYALQWEAIKAAQNAGCEEYDMFGTAPNASPSHPMHGLYRFKRGFGGSIFHRMGCWDYPLNQDDYFRFRAQEINNQKYLLK